MRGSTLLFKQLKIAPSPYNTANAPEAAIEFQLIAWSIFFRLAVEIQIKIMLKLQKPLPSMRVLHAMYFGQSIS